MLLFGMLHCGLSVCFRKWGLYQDPLLSPPGRSGLRAPGGGKGCGFNHLGSFVHGFLPARQQKLSLMAQGWAAGAPGLSLPMEGVRKEGER